MSADKTKDKKEEEEESSDEELEEEVHNKGGIGLRMKKKTLLEK